MKELQNIENIIKKYVHGESNREELERALILFEDTKENLEIRSHLIKFWNNDKFDADQNPGSKEFNELLNEIHHKINLNEKKQKVSRIKQLSFTVAKIAAILFVGLLGGMLIKNFKKTEPVYYTSMAPLGSVSQMILPDSTMVFLNSGSELKYQLNSTNGSRDVFLSGEAWFKVKKNKASKFVVHTPYYNVNVLGTEFNVKAYPEDPVTTTTLEKGIVQVTSTGKLKIEDSLVLKPGEQLSFNKQEKSLEVKKVNTQIFTSWKENKLVFINMSLRELFILLGRKYGVDIDVQDKSLLDFHYDGTIRNETIIEILEILQETLPIQYEIKDQKILITLKNTN